MSRRKRRAPAQQVRKLTEQELEQFKNRQITLDQVTRTLQMVQESHQAYVRQIADHYGIKGYFEIDLVTGVLTEKPRPEPTLLPVNDRG